MNGCMWITEIKEVAARFSEIAPDVVIIDLENPNRDTLEHFPPAGRLQPRTRSFTPSVRLETLKPLNTIRQARALLALLRERGRAGWARQLDYDLALSGVSSILGRNQASNPANGRNEHIR